MVQTDWKEALTKPSNMISTAALMLGMWIILLSLVNIFGGGAGQAGNKVAWIGFIGIGGEAFVPYDDGFIVDDAIFAILGIIMIATGIRNQDVFNWISNIQNSDFANNLIKGNNTLKSKKWDRAALTGIELYGKTLGFVGFGRVARLVAERMHGFGMDIIFFDPYVEESTEKETKKELDELLKEADIVSLHVVKNKETINLISKEKLALMKQDSIVINTSRGGVIDESEVYKLVEEGKLFSAALDVYENEPPEYTTSLTESDAITLPHLGASTREAQLKAGTDTVKNVQSILDGDITTSVNGKEFQKN